MKKTGYRWHLRRLMADRDIYAASDLRQRLAERGIALSREQVWRLVTGIPGRLSLATLAALRDILGCQPGDIIEPVASSAASPAQAPPPGQLPRPVRARVRPGSG